METPYLSWEVPSEWWIFHCYVGLPECFIQTFQWLLPDPPNHRFVRKMGYCTWSRKEKIDHYMDTWQFFVTLLWDAQVTLLRVKWPSTIRDQKVTTWITWYVHLHRVMTSLQVKMVRVLGRMGWFGSWASKTHRFQSNPLIKPPGRSFTWICRWITTSIFVGLFV